LTKKKDEPPERSLRIVYAGARLPSCDYETGSGGACPSRVRWKLTIRDVTAPASISGEPVRYTAHACHFHRDQARERIASQGTGSLRIESEEPL